MYIFWISFIGLNIFALDNDPNWLLDKAYDWPNTNRYVLLVDWEKMVEWESSMLIKLTRLLLRVTSVLWVTMFMYGGILYVMSIGEQWKMQTARKKLIYSGLWIFVALSSIALINLIQSATESTLNQAIDVTNWWSISSISSSSSSTNP